MDGDDDILPELLPELLSSDRFLFCVVSKGRPANVQAVHALLGTQAGKEVWFVGEGEAERKAYEANGATTVISGGGLCKSRNAALAYAQKRGKFCVQLSDDIHGFTFIHHESEWNGPGGGLNEAGYTKPPSLSESNKIAARATTRRLSALGAAQMLAAQMKLAGSKFGGLYVNSNPGTSQMCPPIMYEHFCIGDFFVVDPSSTCRFDEEMKLKEDYDFTCSHLKTYGKVGFIGRSFVRSFSGGCVDQGNSPTCLM